MKLSIGEPDDIAVGEELSVDNGFEDSAPETSDSDNPDSDRPCLGCQGAQIAAGGTDSLLCSGDQSG
ncbi:hypothetical protein LAUMK13_04324 [Mycobacterium innocens]|uniref:Uncharacterized protein n=1 Tax=Mycobacterium innocens TaxID=2341083 RepID=A0A498QE08_9MYCO|nr:MULTISPECIES: hypothetical protein [Mycobacterium]VBA43004.1 hypothetical protein LAUMK13_04324 [Mycobacterium innocens]